MKNNIIKKNINYCFFCLKQCVFILLLFLIKNTIAIAEPTPNTATASQTITNSPTNATNISNTTNNDKNDLKDNLTTQQANQRPNTSKASDPFETYNRNAFRMNTTIDKNVIRPTTVWYIDYVPSPLQSALANFFNNLRDFITLGNDILQLKGIDAMHNTMRIAINSTIGLAGFIDISSSLGLKMHKNSFGKTFQTYGWKNSSYFVIPLLGPSTVRDALGLIPDIFLNPTWYLFNDYFISIGLFVVNGIDTRAKYLDTDQLVYSAFDPYTTMRDFYLQNVGQDTNNNKDNNVNIDQLLIDSPTTPNESQAQTNKSATPPNTSRDTNTNNSISTKPSINNNANTTIEQIIINDEKK